MTHQWPEGESIRVALDARGQPAALTVRGRTLKVRRVRKRWTVDLDWWEADGRVWREYFRVEAERNALCEIYFDFVGESWHMSEIYD